MPHHFSFHRFANDASIRFGRAASLAAMATLLIASAGRADDTPAPTPSPTPSSGSVDSASLHTDYVIGASASISHLASSNNNSDSDNSQNGNNTSAGLLFGLAQTYHLRYYNAVLFNFLDGAQSIGGTDAAARLLNPFNQGNSFQFTTHSVQIDPLRPKYGYFLDIGTSIANFKAGVPILGSATTQSETKGGAVGFLFMGPMFISPTQYGENGQVFGYSAQLGLSARVLMGNASRDKAFRTALFGTGNTCFVGPELLLQANIGSIYPFLRVAYFGYKSSEGFNGAQVSVGVNALDYIHLGSSGSKSQPSDPVSSLDTLLSGKLGSPLAGSQDSINNLLEDIVSRSRNSYNPYDDFKQTLLSSPYNNTSDPNTTTFVEKNGKYYLTRLGRKNIQEIQKKLELYPDGDLPDANNTPPSYANLGVRYLVYLLGSTSLNKQVNHDNLPGAHSLVSSTNNFSTSDLADIRQILRRLRDNNADKSLKDKIAVLLDKKGAAAREGLARDTIQGLTNVTPNANLLPSPTQQPAPAKVDPDALLKASPPI